MYIKPIVVEISWGRDVWVCYSRHCFSTTTCEHCNKGPYPIVGKSLWRRESAYGEEPNPMTRRCKTAIHSARRCLDIAHNAALSIAHRAQQHDHSHIETENAFCNLTSVRIPNGAHRQAKTYYQPTVDTSPLSRFRFSSTNQGRSHPSRRKVTL